MLLVYRLFALLLARLGACAPIPYVQDAILNLRQSYIVVATTTTDIGGNAQNSFLGLYRQGLQAASLSPLTNNDMLSPSYCSVSNNNGLPP